MALVNKSMLRRDSDGRYQVHELLRQFGAEQMAESPPEELEVQATHCRYFAAFMAAHEPLIWRREQLTAMAEIKREFDNLRVAWEAATRPGCEAEFRPMALCLFAYLVHSGLIYEWEAWFGPAAASWRMHPEAESSDVCLALAWVGVDWGFRWQLTGGGTGSKLSQQAISLLRHYDCPREMALALWTAGISTTHQSEKLTLFHEFLLCAEATGDLALVGQACIHIANVLCERTEYEQSDSYLQKAAEAIEPTGDRDLIGFLLASRGWLSSSQGAYTRAAAYFQQALTLFQELGNIFSTTTASIMLADTVGRQGDWVEAERRYQEVLAIAHESGDRRSIAKLLFGLGWNDYLQGHFAEAKRHSQEAIAYFQQEKPETDIIGPLENLAAANAALGAYAEAENQFRTALQSRLANKHFLGILWNIAGMAALFGKVGQKERSVELLTLTCEHPTSVVPFKRDIYDRFIVPLQAELPPEAFAAAQTRGRALDLETVAAEILASPPLFSDEADSIE
jgi:tetratricopeptide (TPR) repeat protein